MVCFHVKIMACSKDRKLPSYGLLKYIYFVQLGENISNKFNFGVKFFRTHFSKIFSSLSCIFEMFCPLQIPFLNSRVCLGTDPELDEKWDPKCGFACILISYPARITMKF